ncbi:hypothetical protein Tco_1124449 [Tanacetum coccineum]|uniref:Uncharacterized protein n=1 Tax=Tanacetum coccineum TaxID=301880 RepID=A0ABQ5J687_9ASTR
MTNKKVVKLDAEFIKYKAEAKASMYALERKIDDGIEKLEASIKAIKEESNVKLDAKFEELRKLILGTPPSQSTHVDHDPQITKVAAKTAPYVPPIRRYTTEATVDVSEESNPEPARKQTASRRVVKKKVTISAVNNIIPDPDVVLIVTKSVPEPARRRPSGTGGSSEGTGRIPRVPDEPTVISATSSEGTGTIPGVDTDEEEEKKDEDDKSINIEKTNDEETDDEFMHSGEN